MLNLEISKEYKEKMDRCIKRSEQEEAKEKAERDKKRIEQKEREFWQRYAGPRQTAVGFWLLFTGTTLGAALWSCHHWMQYELLVPTLVTGVGIATIGSLCIDYLVVRRESDKNIIADGKIRDRPKERYGIATMLGFATLLGGTSAIGFYYNISNEAHGVILIASIVLLIAASCVCKAYEPLEYQQPT